MAGWRSLRYPGLSDDLRCYNERLVRDLGLFDAPYSDYGRLAHRTLEMPLDEVIDRLIEPWRVETYSPDWRHGDIVNALRRNPHRSQTVPVLLLGEPEQPRVRRWDDRLGFVNLFQGRDVRPAPGAPFYPGDRSVPSVESDPDRVVIQIHCVTRRDRHDPYTLLTPAVYLGQRPIVTRS